MPGSFPIASVQGIAIRAHPTAVFAFLLLIFLLASVYFPDSLPREQPSTYLAVAFISTLFLYLSTLAHELGHALVARARGVPAETITFVMFTSASDVQREGERPLDEVFIAIAGPTVSLAIAALAALARFGLPAPSEPLTLFLEAVLLLNLWLGVFTLVPSLPLDGGRVLRGLLWHGIGDFQVATRVASVVARVLAAALFAAGVGLVVIALDPTHSPLPMILSFDTRLVGVATIVAAWFLNSNARNAYRQVELQQRFRGVTVEQLMSTDPATVPPWMSIAEVVDQFFVQRGERAVAVVRDDQSIMGLLAYADVRRIPRSEWGARAVGEVMTAGADLVTVAPSDSIELAIRRMAERHYNQLPVVDAGRLVGMISRVNVLRFADLRDGGRRARRR